MVTTTLSLLNADASAINTVNFSNHTGYEQFSGRRTPAAEIRELYNGLVMSHLAEDFDILLTGYTGSAEAVQSVGDIARDLRRRRGDDLFWIMDPVMGDAGRLYVAADIPQVYRSLSQLADLVLPNAFELEVLTEMSVTDLRSCVTAMESLHQRHGVRNVVVTSLRLGRQDLTSAPLFADLRHDEILGVVGSTSTSDGSSRPFLLTITLLPVSFRGTGDMFAALMAVRLREAALSRGLVGNGASWSPGNDITATELPLAKATEKVLASIYAVLAKTAKRRDTELVVPSKVSSDEENEEKAQHLRTTKASEVRVVQHVEELRNPPINGFNGVQFTAQDVATILSRLP
ncbi:MAG: hypothetical protein Q9159_002177 [Coniocarpon cinnabarinum]